MLVWEYGLSGALASCPSGNTGRNLKERARLGVSVFCSVHNRSFGVCGLCVANLRCNKVPMCSAGSAVRKRGRI